METERNIIIKESEITWDVYCRSICGHDEIKRGSFETLEDAVNFARTRPVWKAGRIDKIIVKPWRQK